MPRVRAKASRSRDRNRKPSCRVLELLEQDLEDIGGDLVTQRMMPLTDTAHEGDAVGSPCCISIVARTVSNGGGDGGSAIPSYRISSHQTQTNGQPGIAATVGPQIEWIMVLSCQPRVLRQL